jgi:predicted aspartyl protease
LKKKDSGEGDGKTVRFVNRVSGLDEVEDDDLEEFDFLSIHRMSRMGRNEDFEDPVMVGMNINGKQASLELDTGAVVTVMSTDTYEKYGGDDDLEKSRYALRTYTGEVVRPKGVGSVKVEYEGQKCDLPVTVVDLDTPTLMGRDWLKSLRLNWEELFGNSKAVNKTEVEDQRVVDLMEEFEEVFTEKLGCLKDFEVHIPVDTSSNSSIKSTTRWSSTSVLFTALLLPNNSSQFKRNDFNQSRPINVGVSRSTTVTGKSHFCPSYSTFTDPTPLGLTTSPVYVLNAYLDFSKSSSPPYFSYVSVLITVTTAPVSNSKLACLPFIFIPTITGSSKSSFRPIRLIL